jgi:hypothetical protein
MLNVEKKEKKRKEGEEICFRDEGAVILRIINIFSCFPLKCAFVMAVGSVTTVP